VLSDATAEGSFTTDPYVTSRKPKALLCTPLLQKAEVIGAIYLENNLVPGAENSGRLRELMLQVTDQLPEDRLANVSELVVEINKVEELLDKALRIIDGSVNRGLRITALILNYARIGKTPVGCESIPVEPLVNRVLDPFRESFAAHRISLTVDIPEACTFTGTELHFHAIVQHLVSNARDALLELKDDGRRAIRLEVVDKPARQVLSVSDNGIGISAELHERIFEPFFSTKPSTGTGLGLGMIRKLASLYSGVIEVESAPQCGATFRVILPKQRRPA
jgi:signal transduction histidine kinase